MTSFKPKSNYILVKPDEAEKTTKSGIIIPKTAQDDYKTGTVVAVGEGRWEYGEFVETETKPDEEIMYTKHAGKEIKFEGTNYVVIRESDIIGTITNNQ